MGSHKIMQLSNEYDIKTSLDRNPSLHYNPIRSEFSKKILDEKLTTFGSLMGKNISNPTSYLPLPIDTYNVVQMNNEQSLQQNRNFYQVSGIVIVEL